VEATLCEMRDEGLVIEEAAVAGDAVGVGVRVADVGAEGEAGGKCKSAGGAGGLGWHFEGVGF
jgi:hypothetical protein